jgi:antitoxin VapB
VTFQLEQSCEAASAPGASDELKQKHQRIQQLMKERSLDALLISRHENIAWASAGLVDVRVGLARETGAGSLLFTRDGPSFYLTGSNEARRLAEEEFDGLEFQPIIQPWWANDVSLSIRQVIGSGKVAGDVSLSGVELISLQLLRLSLMDREIDRYRWLGRRAADAVSDVLQDLRPGISEVMMQSMLLARLLADGILPTVSLTATDDRIRSYRHAVPREGVLRQFGMLGFCARRWGLTVSMTRFVHFGEMPAELDEKFRTVAYVSARLLDATREGALSEDLFATARYAYTERGYTGEELMHHQGGATGYLEREWFARPGGTERALSQEAFAWNPNLQGAKVEDTVVLHGGNVEVLTATPRLPEVVTSLDGIQYRSASVLQR